MTVERMIQKLAALKEELLEKWQRSGSLTMVNREAHYQALMAVKDHVIKYVAKIVEGMKPDEIKHVPIAGTELTVRQIMPDMYSGQLRRGPDIIHEFDRITIPQLAGQLQSLLELYDPDKPQDGEMTREQMIDKLKPLAEQGKDGLVSQLMTILAGQEPKQINSPEEAAYDPVKEINEIIAEANLVTEEAQRRMHMVDPRAEVEDLKERVESMLHRVESVVSRNAPTSKDSDKLQDTLHQVQQKHDLLTDRVQQELNLLNDKIKLLTDKLGSRGSGEKVITITVS